MDDKEQACHHERILTWHVEETGEVAGLWSCAACNRKFAPLDGASSWQPIETAPKDGTVVLYCDSRGNRWTDCSPGHPRNGCGERPTHWMPLPQPPKE